jgi:hypothetical protein
MFLTKDEKNIQWQAKGYDSHGSTKIIHKQDKHD